MVVVRKACHVARHVSPRAEPNTPKHCLPLRKTQPNESYGNIRKRKKNTKDVLSYHAPYTVHLSIPVVNVAENTRCVSSRRHIQPGFLPAFHNVYRFGYTEPGENRRKVMVVVISHC